MFGRAFSIYLSFTTIYISAFAFFIGTKYVKQKSNENAQIFGEKT